jgi:hypothetical protein
MFNTGTGITSQGQRSVSNIVNVVQPCSTDVVATEKTGQVPRHQKRDRSPRRTEYPEEGQTTGELNIQNVVNI